MSKEDFNIQDDESCNDNVCSCCVARETHITKFIDDLMEIVQKGKGLSLESLLESTDEFYSTVYLEGKTDALKDIIGYAAHEIHGHEEDEDEDIQ